MTKKISGSERYELTDSDVEKYITKLQKSHLKTKNRTKRYGVHTLMGSDVISDIARRLECDVFDEFFGNDANVLAKEYGPYEPYSEFIVVLDYKIKKVVGVVRLIKHSDASLKTFVDTTSDNSPWKLTHDKIKTSHKINYDRTWDIATIAVKRRYRRKIHRRLIRSLLLNAIHKHSLSNEAEHWVALLDDIHIKTFEELGIPIEQLAGSKPQPYLGSKSTTPIVVKVHSVSSSVKKKSRTTHTLLLTDRILGRFASF